MSDEALPKEIVLKGIERLAFASNEAVQAFKDDEVIATYAALTDIRKGITLILEAIMEKMLEGTDPSNPLNRLARAIELETIINEKANDFHQRLHEVELCFTDEEYEENVARLHSDK